jgi:hypothetical protein
MLALTQLYVYWLRMDGSIERTLKTALDVEHVASLLVPPPGELAIDDGPFWGAMAVMGDRRAVVTELGVVHLAPFDGSDVSTLQVLSGGPSSAWPLDELSGVDASENEALLTGPSCDQVFRVGSDGTVASLVERESASNLRSKVRGTAERFWCAGTTLSRYQGAPPAPVVEIEVTATDFCEMEDAVVGIANETPSSMFRTDVAGGGEVVELPDTEGATRLACASDALTYWARPDDEGNLHLMALDAEGTSTKFHELPAQRLGAWEADTEALYWLEDGKLVRWPRSALPE